MKALKRVFITLIMAVFAGMFIATAAALPVIPVIGGLTFASLIPTGSQGAAYVGAYREVWTGEMIKAFTHEATFLAKVPDYSRYVGNDVIHLVDVGAHPEVLIDNTTYPLVPQNLGETDVSISLHKFETVATSITHDEIHAISYPKIKAAHDLHREALQMESSDKAAHAFAPVSHTADTPVLETTGADRGDGFRRMTIADLVKLKKAYDDIKAPRDGRVLVLTPDHVQDLLLLDETFKNQYQNITEGKILRLYGFEIHEYISNPVYDGTTLVKKAYGAASEGTDRTASFSFINKEMFKARGSVEAFLQEAKNDVLNKRNLCSFNLRFVALPKKARAIGAIINGTV